MIFSIISVFVNVLRMLRYYQKWSILHKYHNIIRIISEHLPYFFFTMLNFHILKDLNADYSKAVVCSLDPNIRVEQSGHWTK